MKKVFLSVFLLAVGISLSARAEPLCASIAKCQDMHKDLEAQLKRVNSQIQVLTVAPKATWLEIDGVYWTTVLEGAYDNEDMDGTKPLDGTIQRSLATETCKNIKNKDANGKMLTVTLPSKDDFSKFKGDAIFLAIPGVKSHWLWSSTIVTGNPGTAYGYNGHSGKIDYHGRNFEGSVMCVGH